MMFAKTLVFGMLFVLASCGAPDIVTESGVIGQVTTGPTCPVEEPGRPCANRPVVGLIRVTPLTSDEAAGVTKSDEDGKFRLTLAPGRYTVTVSAPGTFGCKPLDIQIPKDTFVQASIICESGIR
ncbi:MAG: carboxypeptidase-like regulatory domain-containing protein [Actinomycetota bacterium]